jgi:hypothetical protein
MKEITVYDPNKDARRTKMLWKPYVKPYTCFRIGDEVRVVGEVRRVGLCGTVVKETKRMVVIADDAGHVHWFSLGDVIRADGVYW